MTMFFSGELVDGRGYGYFNVVVWCRYVFWCDRCPLAVPLDPLDESEIVAVSVDDFFCCWPGVVEVTSSVEET